MYDLFSHVCWVKLAVLGSDNNQTNNYQLREYPVASISAEPGTQFNCWKIQNFLFSYFYICLLLKEKFYVKQGFRLSNIKLRWPCLRKDQTKIPVKLYLLICWWLQALVRIGLRMPDWEIWRFMFSDLQIYFYVNSPARSGLDPQNLVNIIRFYA